MPSEQWPLSVESSKLLPSMQDGICDATVIGKSLPDAALHHARFASFDEVLPLVERDVSVWQCADEDGHTLLHWAALAGDTVFISKALAAGVSVDVRAQNGQTPFMWAMIRGRLSAAKLLLQARADLYAKDSRGATGLILAVQHAKVSSLLLAMALGQSEELLAQGDDNGCNAYHWAAYKGDLHSMRLLEYFDADVSALDKNGMTPLHRAAQSCQLASAKHLLDKQVNHLLQDKSGRTAMDIAVASTSGKDIAHEIFKCTGQLLPDPSTNKTAATTGTTAPTVIVDNSEDLELGATLRRVAAQKAAERDFRERARRSILPAFWLACVGMSYFEYLTDFRTLSWETVPGLAFAFEIGGPVCLILFAICSCSDPGKVAPRPKGASGVEELLEAMRSANPDWKTMPDISRLCTSTWIIKDLRTKYCPPTGACVRDFDHFCAWLNVAIGRGNHRVFVVLTFAEVLTQLCYLCLAWSAGKDVVVYKNVFQYASGLTAAYPLLAIVLPLHVMSAPAILLLLVNHLYQIAINMTTNEMINVARYQHFWTDVEDGTSGKLTKKFRNPFHRGNSLLNCWDFWTGERRSDFDPL
eukprot:TRINITY_DN59554_c0_g2_i1.p1 TRINITY_DN59554_c0_g2~~TRINITY_DN59554_c0_g2_i1.p1  ORF type:complete len:595 (-),score=56.43 TRINITY_DN59554_c0_g2_i1:139-1890(-)